jgi:hypothetical protein
MKKNALKTLSLVCIVTLMSCIQNKKPTENKIVEKSVETVNSVKQAPHNYGGWYCPDNLNGFPAVDLLNWKNVPVVNGRLATKEETQNGTSLIFVDTAKYPDARPLDIEMPKLGRFYNSSTKKDELIIIIQAVKISADAVVGFRYLNGGNGSARLNEVTFLSENEIDHLSPQRFVVQNITINAAPSAIWKILTKPEYYKTLQAVFDPEGALIQDLNTASKVNFKYRNGGAITSEFAANVYGNQYIQIDSKLKGAHYVEKFLLLENIETKTTELKIVCGPYFKNDFESQKKILHSWGEKVKALSEGK